MQNIDMSEIDNDWLISEIEEDLLSDDSTESKRKRKIYSLSKFSEMFKSVYADHFEKSAKKKKRRDNRSTLGECPIEEVSNDSSDSLKR